MTTSSSIGYGLTFSQSSAGQTASGEEASLSEDMSLGVAVAIGAPADTGADAGLGALAYGNATAVGVDTLAVGAFEATAAFGSGPGIASASASGAAAALDTDGGVAFAAVDVGAEIMGDFDIVISTSSTQSAVLSAGSTSFWYEAASTSVTGIAIADGGSNGGGDSVTQDDSGAPGQSGDPQAVAFAGDPEPTPWPGDCSDVDLDFEGNIAIASVGAEAFGADSYASASFDVLSIEDSLSTVDAIVIAEVAL
ncbi:MAG: hypothetical protein R3D33_13645 [Hyphomicrobiaceae bacterium]